MTGRAPAAEPPLDGSDRDHELVGDHPLCAPPINGVDDPDAEIFGVGFHPHTVPEGPPFMQTAVYRKIGLANTFRL
jgi:hypothetical protein